MLQSIRKFGLQYCELPSMLANVDIFLRILTIRIYSRNEKPIPTIFYILTIISAISYFYVYLISMAVFVFKCSKSGDVLSALIVLSLGVSSEIGTIKLCSMFYYQQEMRDIVSQCLACDALVAPGSRFSANLMKTLRVVKRRAVVFWSVLIVNGIVYVMKPLLLPGRHLMEDIFVLYGLEPMFQSPNYEIAFTVMAIGVAVTVYLPANVTAFLIIISGYIEAQMHAWSEELLHLWDDAEREYIKIYTDRHSITNNGNEVISSIHYEGDEKDQAINAIVRKRLKTIISSHSTNVAVLRQVEGVFRTAIAVEFLLLIVGLIAELLGGLANTYMEIPFALMQVAMDCLTGQRLMDASLVFEQAVYACNWERLDLQNMKLVLVILQNSQKTLTLSAGGITTLNFVSLMAVIKSIYSTYTTLRSTM